MRITAWAKADAETLAKPPRPEWLPAGARRRQDPLTRLACAVVDQCLGQKTLASNSAIVVATAYGSVESTLKFARSMREHGDHQASPTPFTSSVHNATAGALGELLGVHGPTTTISQGNRSCTAAMHWAMMMVNSGRAPSALVVCGDLHNGWSAATVQSLSGVPWDIGSGCSALLIEGQNSETMTPGHQLAWSGEATIHIDGGGLSKTENKRLADSTHHAAGQRQCAPEIIQAWWPTCLLDCLPFHGQQAHIFKERDSHDQAEFWLGPFID